MVVAPGATDETRTVEVGDHAGGRARVIRVRGLDSPYDPTYHLFVRFHEVRRIVAREAPDVLEIHSPYLAALGVLLAARGDAVRTFQWHSDFIDTYAGVLDERTGGRFGPAITRVTRPLWGLVRAIGRRCDATMVASRGQRDKLERHGVPRVVLLPFGVEKSVFAPSARSEEARRAWLARAGIADDRALLLVAVGRFAIEKRWDVVLDAVATLRAQEVAGGPRVALVIFGDGPERTKIEARAEALGGIVVAGFVRDRKALAEGLASADMLVHGCPCETFGLSIAEAMATGIPAVIPDEGGAAEMHRVGVSERYRSGDPVGLARGVLRLAERRGRDPAGLRSECLERLAAIPSVEDQFAAQVRLYEDLRGARRATGAEKSGRAKGRA